MGAGSRGHAAFMEESERFTFEKGEFREEEGRPSVFLQCRHAGPRALVYFLRGVLVRVDGPVEP
jgi:hypothetical protein